MPPPQECPISPAADLIFSKWTATVLWTLDHHGRLRFTELRRALPAITAKVLAQRLRQLESDGLVTRDYHAEMPPRVEYELTELARSLTPIFESLGDWSERHFDEVLAARARFAATDAEQTADQAGALRQGLRSSASTR